MVKKLDGSVKAVYKQQALVYADQETNESLFDAYIEIFDSGINETTIKRDLPRTSLVDYTGKSYEDFANECKKASVYAQHYRQSNLDGSEILLLATARNSDHVSQLQDEIDQLANDTVAQNAKTTELDQFYNEWMGIDHQKALRFAYRDQTGQLCGFTLMFNDLKPENWSMQIIKNTIAPLELRTTSVFSQGRHATAGKSNDIELSELSEEIALALNAPMVNQLVSGLIDADGKASLAIFIELSARLSSGKNIDNRDFRQSQFEELVNIAEINQPEGLSLAKHIEDFRKQSLNDPNFFSSREYLSHLDNFLREIKSSTGSSFQEKQWVYRTELTVDAIKLEVMASDFKDEVDRHKKNGLLQQAKNLRGIRDTLSSSIEMEEINFSELVSQATGILSGVSDYEENLEKVERKLLNLQELATTRAETDFLNQAKELVQNIQAVAGVSPGLLGREGLDELNQLVKRYFSVLKSPGDSSNSATLKALSQKIPNQASPVWQPLQAGLQKLATFDFEHLGLVGEYKDSIGLFNQNLVRLKAGVGSSKSKLEFYQQGKKLLADITAFAGDDPSKLNKKDLVDLNQVLDCCTPILVNQNNTKKINEMANLSQEVSGKASPFWKKLGAGLLVFAALALVVTGVLAAIPSGGTSLLLVALGAVGVSTGVAAAAAGGTTALAAGSGAVLFKTSSEKGLAKSVSEFKSAISKLQNDEKSEIDSGLGSDNDSSARNSPSSS